MVMQVLTEKTQIINEIGADQLLLPKRETG
jgi:hypothetical protein